MVRLTDRPDMTLDVYRGRKTTNQSINQKKKPWSGKNLRKMNFFPGQGKIREICGWSGKFGKDLESGKSQGT